MAGGLKTVAAGDRAFGAATRSAINPQPTASAPSTSGSAALTANARADATMAAAAAAQASQTAQQVQSLVASAQSAFAEVQTLAAPARARQPAATDPATVLAPLTAAASAISGATSTVQAAASSASDAAAAASKIAHQDSDAQSAAADAAAAVQGVHVALQGVQKAGKEVASWTQQAQTAVAAWQKIHAAPPGYFGMETGSPPADWTVQGCEVITANPGGPAATAGLIGRNQRTDPVGDVITSVADATDAHASWPVTNCASLTRAIAQTRAGDQVTIDYYHRQVVLLIGKWAAESGTATLTRGGNPTCPPALTGTITSQLVGNRILLQVELSGPAGTRGGLHVMLDTGGVDTIFPDSLLRQLGYRPFGSEPGSGVVPGATTTDYLYHVPGSAIRVLDHGSYVPLATGTLTVIGIPGGTDYGLGPDILKHGAKLSTSGSRWTLTPPCG